MKKRSTQNSNSQANTDLRVRSDFNNLNYFRLKKNLQRVIIALLVLLMPNFIFGQSPPTLGTTTTYALFTAVGAFSNIGNATVVTGDVGTNAGAFTAFPPGVLVGQKHVADPGSVAAAIDVNVAYSYLFGLTCGETLANTTLGNGQTLGPKVYCLGAASTLNGNLVLDGGGDPNALFIFKINGALATSVNASITLKGVSPCNVYWQINGAFTLGDNSVFVGTLLVNGAIHLLEGSSLTGRALSREGAIDLHNNVVKIPECKVTPPPGGCPTPTISGPKAVCESYCVVYTTEPGMTNYLWKVSSGGSVPPGCITSSIVTVCWNEAGNQTLSVTYTGPNGCTETTSAVYNVTVSPSLVPTITGSATACVNSTGNVYTTEPGMTNYGWTIPSGGTITAGGTPTSNSATVTWNTAGAHSVNVTYTNNDNCTVASPTVYNVTVNPCNVTPCPAPTITGPSAVCATYCTVYTTEPGMTNYLWTISSGGALAPGCIPGANTITVCWKEAGPQTVSVNYTNGNCTATSPTVFNVTVSPSQVPSITGPATVCKNSTGNVYTTEPGMTNYGWTVSSGGTITSGGTSASNSATVTWNTDGARTVSVSYTNANSCTVAAPTVYNVTVNPCIVTPCPVPTITGPSAVCETYCTVYTTEPGMTNYLWSFSSGGTLAPECILGANSITICWSKAGPQTVSVNYTNGSCTAASPTVYNVTVSPSMVPSVTGPATVNETSTGNVYTTESGMTNYGWIVSSGGTITSGGTSSSNTVTVTWNKAGNQTVSVTYTNANSCTVASPTVYKVTVNLIPAQVSYNLYPQPTNGHFTVSIENPKDEVFAIEIYNMYGSKVYELRNIKLNGGRLDQQIELPPLANGLYSVVFSSGKDKVYRRIVVQK